MEIHKAIKRYAIASEKREETHDEIANWILEKSLQLCFNNGKQQHTFHFDLDPESYTLFRGDGMENALQYQAANTEGKIKIIEWGVKNGAEKRMQLEWVKGQNELEYLVFAV